MIQQMDNLCWDQLGSSAGFICLSLKWLQSALGSAGAGWSGWPHLPVWQSWTSPPWFSSTWFLVRTATSLLKDDMCSHREWVLMYNHSCAWVLSSSCPIGQSKPGTKPRVLVGGDCPGAWMLGALEVIRITVFYREFCWAFAGREISSSRAYNRVRNMRHKLLES